MKIAFACCMRREAFNDQPIWKDVARAAPDCLLLLGDQIYMDFGYLPPEPLGAPRYYDDDKFREYMERKYRAQWNEPNFRALFQGMQEKRAVFGIWDDHDFAWNNAKGLEVSASKKRISREAFNFWMYGKRADQEIYRIADFHPDARIVLLDTRYHADKNRQLLGAAQWDFLEGALAHDKRYTILCSGITLDRGTENWRGYAAEYARLAALLAGRKGLLFLSGDIHENAFNPPGAGRPCYEIISSGAAINRYGLPFAFDDRHNWGLLELGAGGIAATLHDKKGVAMKYWIDAGSWTHRREV
jgi:phosphodiesterase/alkaline phosphatase D-like protein